MTCLDSLNMHAPVISVIGSGGKSTLLAALAREYAARGRTAILATTTHFTAAEPGLPLVLGEAGDEVPRALSTHGAVYVGAPVAGTAGKLGPSPIPIARLSLLADHVIVEADGSRCLPLKAHASHEPVIPAETGRCLCLVGASGFGRSVDKAVHRPELFCEWAGCGTHDVATPALVARAMAEEARRGLIAPDAVIVNQAEGPARAQDAIDFSDALRRAGCAVPVFAGSVREGRLKQIA